MLPGETTHRMARTPYATRDPRGSRPRGGGSSPSLSRGEGFEAPPRGVDSRHPDTATNQACLTPVVAGAGVISAAGGAVVSR